MWRHLISLPRPLAIVVGLSLLINVFLISALLTQRFAPRATARDAVDRPIARLINKLPAADAQVLRQAQRQRRPELASARAAFDAALLAAGQVAAQEPINTVALQQALDEVRRKRQAVTDLHVQFYAQVIPQLSSEGRRQITLPD
jgi:uncharacterized membrane protein